MRQSFFLALISVTAVLSASNILPISNLKEPFALNGQENDNTFRYKTRNNLDDLFYKIYVEHQNRPINKTPVKYTGSQDDDIFSIMHKNDNYDGKGFRKEQWHNYPRQLDRLHKLFGYKADKRNVDPDPGDEVFTNENAVDYPNDIANEFLLESNALFDDTDPLLILKIRLAYLNNDIDEHQYKNEITSENFNDEENELTKETPTLNGLKVKREDNELTETSASQSKTVKKRIFSFWSRLQSLNHKGHELHHRRHLHAYYNLPDSDGGGALTAEPRAIFMRPPGSPLRWG